MTLTELIKMNNWYKYWNEIPEAEEKADYLKQVGHTIAGQPYSEDAFNEMVTGIRHSLALQPQDMVLDLCCGNGIITSQLSPFCKTIVGIDFSIPLIEIANKIHRPGNVSYHRLDVMRLETLQTPEYGRFNKILMYGALQHLRKQDFKPLLETILKLSSADPTILFGGIPDVRRRNRFLNSFRKKMQFILYKILGRDRIGVWWNPAKLKNTCAELGLECEIDDNSHGRPGAHYRFDALIFRRT